MGIFEDEDAEAVMVEALKFVKVSIGYKAELISGLLTETSIAMIMVEMKRRGITISLPNGDGDAR